MRKSFIYTFAAAAALSGCETGPESTMHVLPTVGPQDGWVVYDKPQHGFSMAAPTNWALRPPSSFPPSALGMSEDEAGRFDASPGDMARNGDFGKEFQQMQAAEDKQMFEQQERDGLLLVLFDQGRRPLPGEEIARFYVRKRNAGHISLERAAEQEASQLQGVFMNQAIDLPIGKVQEIQSRTKNRAGDENTELVYVIPHKGDVYTVTFVMTNAPEDLTPQARPIMQTFRVK